METEEAKEKNLHGMIDSMLHEDLNLDVPPGFTDRFMRRLQQKLAWHDILMEFFWKAALVLLLLGFAAAVLFIPAFRYFLSVIVAYSAEWKLILYPVILIVITLTFDQILLKYLFIRKK